MKKVAIASLLALSAFTVAPASITRHGAASAQAPTGQVQMDAAEFADYDNAMNKQTTPQTQAPALEAYLAKYPKSTVRTDILQRIMLDYSQFDPAKALTAADNFLAVSPSNLQAYVIEVAYRKQAAEDPKADAATKTAALDAAASYAKKGLDVTKLPVDPKSGMTADQLKAVVDFATPTFYAAIGEDAMNNKDSAGAVAAYKAELAAMKPDQLTTPAALQEVFYLAQAYRIATPPDFTNCAFYATRAATLAPAQFQAQLQPTATYCYKKQHGSADGYDAVVAAAKAGPNPPAGFAIAPAPTDKDIADNLMKTTADADIPKLATGDKEFVLANAGPENATKVWDSIKGKAVEIPGALVIESTPTVVKVAVSDDAVQGKKADFTFNLKPLETPEEPKAKTAVAVAKYKKEKAAYDKQVADIADATTVGKTVTLDGTYDSYTPSPIMIVMNEGAVVLPKAAAPKAAAPKAPVHAAAHRK